MMETHMPFRSRPSAPHRPPVGRARRRGFTLLEVMMATSILAVGSVSVLMVFATATGFAHRRQAGQQLTQVLDEARSDARAHVNAYRPVSARPAAGARRRAGSSEKDAAAPSEFPGGPEGRVPSKSSTVFQGYSYDLRFEPVVKGVPESGWRTTIRVTWGDAQEHVETTVFSPDVIPDEEFAYSLSYEEERAGTADRKGPKEK